MKLRSMCLFALVAASSAAGEQKVTPELLYQEAWYLEEGLRDPAGAVGLYTEVASKFPGNKTIAAKALTRAAGCYGKLGKQQLERDIWVQAWRDYKEEIEKMPEIQHDYIPIISRIENLAVGPSSDLAIVFSDILDQMQAAHIIPVRDRMLDKAEKQRESDPWGAVRSLRFAILLSTKLEDKATAAAAQSRIGEIWFEHEVFEAAILAYFEAQRYYPNQLGVLAWNEMKMAEAYRLRDRMQDALGHYNDLLRSYPDQAEQRLWGKLWMGDCQRDLGQFEAAERLWRDLAESKEAEAYPRQQRLARMLVGLEEAPAKLDTSAKDEFTNDEAYFISVRHEMEGDTEAALRFLEQTIAVSIGKDWPCMLASQQLAARLDIGDE
jgi:tetratricopeptide (TPR) repeat protein